MEDASIYNAHARLLAELTEDARGLMDASAVTHERAACGIETRSSLQHFNRETTSLRVGRAIATQDVSVYNRQYDCKWRHSLQLPVSMQDVNAYSRHYIALDYSSYILYCDSGYVT